MTFADSSLPAVRGSRSEYLIVAYNGGNIVALSDWLPNPYKKNETPARSVSRSRGGNSGDKAEGAETPTVRPREIQRR